MYYKSNKVWPHLKIFKGHLWFTGHLVLANRDRTSGILPPRHMGNLERLELHQLLGSQFEVSLEQKVLCPGLSSYLETTNLESVRNLMHSSPISLASMILEMTASYSAWLLVVGNSNIKETSTTNQELFSKITFALFPLLLDKPFVNTTHVQFGSRVRKSSRPGSLQTNGHSNPSLPRRIPQIQTIRWPISSDTRPNPIGIAPALKVNLSELLWNAQGSIVVVCTMLPLSPMMPFRSSSTAFPPSPGL